MLALAPAAKVGKGCLDNAMTIGYPAPGTEVAGYRIEQLLGRGGMGAVYRAFDVRLGRPVALKLLVAGAAPERLLRESQLAARLDHPNVIPIYEAGHQDGRLFIAMRYVAGGDLETLLRREGALPPARSVAIAAQIADALDAAHRRGLVHRDVKPSIVLLDCEDGREHCYLADFGLTQSSTDSGPADGHGMGTIDYVAPEQIRGEPLDGRADQYALACLLFESLTGSVPYRSRSDVAAIFAHLEEPAPRPSEREAELPAAIDGVLERGMAKRSEDRFESCSALVSQARAALGLVARPRSPRWRLAALVAAVLVVAAVVTVVMLGQEASAPAAPTGSLTRVDARTNRVLKRTPVGGHPGNLAVTPGGIWMTDFVDGVLWRYEAAAGRLERITSNGEPRDLAALDGKVYVAADGRFLSGVVSRYDASSGVRDEGIDRLACAVASGEGVLWVAGCPFVQRLSTGEGKLRELVKVFLPFRSPATVENSRAQFRELAVGAGSLWVLGDALDRRMWRLDAHTGRIRETIELGFPPTSAAVSGGTVWITDGLNDRVVPVDVAKDRALAAVRVGRGASAIAAGSGSVWVANTLDGTVSRIDPVTRQVVATIKVGGLPRGLAVGNGAVWVTGYEI
jgi:YVTN family beta-propeller protein